MNFLYTVNAYYDEKCLTLPLSQCKTDSYDTAVHYAKDYAKNYGFCVLKNNESGNREYF